jgi:hypothetical protein
MTSAVMAQGPDVVTVMSKALTDIPGNEVLMITVEYPPGDQTRCTGTMRTVHLRPGRLRRVQGGKEVTLTPGGVSKSAKSGTVEGASSIQSSPRNHDCYTVQKPCAGADRPRPWQRALPRPGPDAR